MKHLIIVGAGGLGRELCNFAKGCIGFSEIFDVRGFLDNNSKVLDCFNGYPPIVGNDEDYVIRNDDIFISAIGDMAIRKKSSDLLCERGAVFTNLIHQTAIVNSNVQMGTGNAIFPYVIIGSDVKMGSNNLLQDCAVIGHDVVIGCCTRIDCHVTLVGGAIVGDGVYVYTGAVVNHGVIIEDGACVGANSFVIRKVKRNTTVFGNPAFKLSR